jgi:DNA-binding NarL/FixJ family response regulator
MQKLINGFHRNGDRQTELTDCELAIFAFVAAGYGIGQIANERGISRKMVETPYANIKLKLCHTIVTELRRDARLASY